MNSNTEIFNAFVTPDFQNRYGTSGGQITHSWGNLLNSSNSYGYNPTSDYFQTGVTGTESISLSTGTDKNQTYVSAAAVNSKGLIPNNKYARYNFTFRNTTSFLDDKMTLDVGATYVLQKDQNMVNQGTYNNPLVGAYLFPRGNDWEDFKMYERYDASRKLDTQYWPVGDAGMVMQNPYWINYRQLRNNNKDRYMLNASLNYKILDWLSVSGRVRLDNSFNDYTEKYYAGTNTQMTESSTRGLYTISKTTDKQLYADFLININKSFGENWNLSANIGTSFMDMRSDGLEVRGPIADENFEGETPGLANVFNVQNLSAKKTKRMQNGWREQTQSVFASAELGYKSTYYLTLTGRNDWPSQLAGPNSTSKSFFYPSVGASLLLNRFVDMGRNIDLFKFRGSYSIVGNDVPVYKTNPRYTYGDQGAINPPESVPFRTLKPEKTHSFEVGFDGEFFQHRLHVNATYYKTNTKNQYFEVTLPWESGYKSQFVNAGNVQNQGFELTAGWFQDFGNEFTWSTDLNLSYNDNKIIELFDGIQDGVTVSNLGGAKVILYEGGQYGDLYVRTLKRDESGKLVTETPEGADYQIPVNGGEQNSDLKYMGNMNSKWNMGWNNTFRYKDLTLSMLIDFRIGGKVVSMTEATLDGYGVSERTGRARDRGYVMREGIKFSNVKAYYDVVGATSFNSVYNVEDYVYDATNVRMREISLGYTFRNLFGQSKNLTLAFIARNLFFFYKDAPMDPDVSMGTGNGLQGFDVFNLPTTRSFGLNVKLNF